VVLAVATAATAYFGGTEVFIASTGRGAGAAGSEWSTTIWVHNPDASAANVQLSFLRRDQANPSSPYVYNDSIPAGDTRRYENAVSTLFGVDGFGAVRVVSDRPVLVNSRIYSTPPGGDDSDTVGQFFAAVPAAFALGFGQSAQILGVYQTAPTASSPFRYNFGFVETTGHDVTVHVIAYDATGASLGARNYDLGPYEVRQYVFADEFPAVSSTNVRLSVNVIAGSGRAIAFGSGLANASNDPSTFEMSFDEALLAGGLAAVVHDASLIGDGTGLSPLGVADGGVTSAKIQDGQVGNADLANNAVTSAKISDGAVTTPDLADSAVTGPKLNTPLALGTTAPTYALQVSNATSGGIPGATLRALNSSTGAGIAGFFETQGSDATLILQGRGTGFLMKGFGGNGGEDELRIDNNGTVHLYDTSHAESVKLDAPSGKASFRSIELSGHGNASLPIAYGVVNSDGTRISGTNNFTSSWDAGFNRYLITITGESYHFLQYVAQVSVPSGGVFRVPVTGDVGNSLAVYILDSGGAKVQHYFHFVVFRP